MKHLNAISSPKKAAPVMQPESKKCMKFGKGCNPT